MGGKLIYTLFHFIHKIHRKFYTLLIGTCFHNFGTKSSIHPPFKFYNLHEISVGKKVVIHPNCWIQTLGSEYSLRTPKIVIHDYVSVGRNTVISAALSITIHKAAMIAPNVYISDYSHEYHDVSTPIIAQGIRNVREVVIGEGCWIGYGTIILPGAMIGNQCVIGANSVVKGVIPDFTVAAGNPAKIIYRYDRDKKIWERTGSNT